MSTTIIIRVRGFPERDICSLPGMGSGLGSRRKCCWRAAVAAVVGVIWGWGHFKKIRNVVFSENKKCCLQSEQRELIQCYSIWKMGGGVPPKMDFELKLQNQNHFLPKTWHDLTAHTVTLVVALWQTHVIYFMFFENRKIWKLVPPKGRPPAGKKNLG